MLFPKRTKYRKMHRRDSYKKEYRVNSLVRGDFGIKSLRSCRLTAKQLEAARKTMVKKMRRMDEFYFEFFQTLLLLVNQLKLEWVKEKGRWITGVQMLIQGESCLNFKVCLSLLRTKLRSLESENYLCRLNLSV